ncbi:MAG: ribbon-helix-helix domain-containing protein [Gammaproteobacteria bacterium]|nr:ribbon-helix-helix domain-containing protein [Gammaproteobacteria bacterium]
MKRITITVEPGDYAAMNRLAKDNDVTVSWLIRRLMREFVERQEREGSFQFEIGRPRRTAGARVQP